MSRKVLIFIPARMGSKRFPGKSLHKIHGVPLICWTYSQAILSGHFAVVITPDEEIKSKMMDVYEIPCILTSDKPKNGTERCAEVLGSPLFEYLTDQDIIINIQGDMVRYDVNTIHDIIYVLSQGFVDYVTAASKLPVEYINDPNRVKVSIKYSKFKRAVLATDFDRKPIPKTKNYLHIGMYGFTKASLERYARLDSTYQENERQLEQMRILDNHVDMGIVFSEIPCVIDCKEDLIIAKKLRNQNGPFQSLKDFR